MRFSSLLILSLLLLSAMTNMAQNDTINECSWDTRDPEFPGGNVGLQDFIRENLQYPTEALKNKIQGVVYIRFVVEPDSTISNILVLRGLGSGCDEEAIRIVEKMPKWTPGSVNGKVCRVQYNIPIRFMLPCDKLIDTADLNDGVHYDYEKIVEVAPQFPGGEDSLNHFLLSQIVYPKEAQDNQIQGTVYVGFTINEDGSVSDVRIMRSVGAGLDEEAMRVISMMPKWTPAQNKGKPTRVDMCIPVRFIMN